MLAEHTDHINAISGKIRQWVSLAKARETEVASTSYQWLPLRVCIRTSLFVLIHLKWSAVVSRCTQVCLRSVQSSNLLSCPQEQRLVNSIWIHLCTVMKARCLEVVFAESRSFLLQLAVLTCSGFTPCGLFAFPSTPSFSTLTFCEAKT